MNRLRTLAAIAVASIGLAGCALVEGLLGPALYSEQELCDEVARIWEGCNVDLGSCRDLVACHRGDAKSCPDQWSAWVHCLEDAEPRCTDTSEVMPCPSEYRDYLSCVSDGTPVQDMILECVCTNGRCDFGLGETPDTCHTDCPQVCSVAPSPNCAPFRTDVCSECGCDLDGHCDPLTENSYTCADCTCDGDGSCNAGESVFDCPGDCACDFDGDCEYPEIPLSCPDCGPCDDGNCQVTEGATCDPSNGCQVPLVCEEQATLLCRLPCMQSQTCPATFTCNSGFCEP